MVVLRPSDLDPDGIIQDDKEMSSLDLGQGHIPFKFAFAHGSLVAVCFNPS